MPRGAMNLPTGVLDDRRKNSDRRRYIHVELARMLGVLHSDRPVYLDMRGVSPQGNPLLITLPVEAAMTMLNDLQRIATEDRWFEESSDS